MGLGRPHSPRIRPAYTAGITLDPQATPEGRGHGPCGGGETDTQVTQPEATCPRVLLALLCREGFRGSAGQKAVTDW